MRCTRLAALFLSIAAVVAAGCAQTTRIDETQLSKTRLATSNKAVAVMRIGAAGTQCDHAAVLLGVRDGAGFRRHTPIRVANIRSINEPAVAEVELEPGEYHVIAYACMGAGGQKVLSQSAGADIASDGGKLYSGSYTSFRLAAGEVVNVGYLHLNASKAGRSQFGRPLRVDIDVTDWPLAELERFKARRPQVFAEMTTRLMKIEYGAPSPTPEDDCARYRQLQAEGKVQSLPAPCGRLPAASAALRKS